MTTKLKAYEITYTVRVSAVGYTKAEAEVNAQHLFTLAEADMMLVSDDCQRDPEQCVDYVSLRSLRLVPSKTRRLPEEDIDMEVDE